MKKALLFWSLLVLPLCSMFAQRIITGTVSDDKEALIGASIVVKGTSKGTVTDVDGKFSLEVPKDATMLLVSFAGATTQEVPIGASNVLDVKLKSEILQ